MKKNDTQINALLGKETEFEGKLVFTGAVRIDGRFKGEILSEGTLIVGKAAYIESDIHASNVIISGEVHGNISAGTRIEIYAPGKVFGNLQSPILTVEEGVVFEGNCQMPKDSAAKDKKVAVLHNDKGSESKTSG